MLHSLWFVEQVLVHLELIYSTLHRDIDDMSLVILLGKKLLNTLSQLVGSFVRSFHSFIHSCGIRLP